MTDENIIIDESALPPQGSPQLPLSVLVTRRPRNVYAGMWGVPEIIAVAVGSLALFGAILLYLFVVEPSNRELAKNRSEADRLEAELATAKMKYGEITSTEEQVGKLLRSVDDFETRFLPASTNGQSALYQRLNGLIIAYGLTNTTGPDYAPLGTADQNVANQTDAQRGREKFRSLFPGVYVTMTLEGSYQSLRRFIREIEAGNEFVVISSITLEPSESEAKKPPIGAPPAQTATNPAGAKPLGNPKDQMAGLTGATRTGPITGQPQAGPTPQKGKTHGEIVALRLEMAAYFRRANYAPMSSPAVTK